MLALAGAGFYGYHVGPVYLDNMAAREACTEAFNIYWVEGGDIARTKLLFRLNGTPETSHLATDENGVESIVPGLGVDPENVTLTLDPDTKQLTVRIEYDRVVKFTPLNKYKKFHLVAEKIGKRIK